MCSATGTATTSVIAYDRTLFEPEHDLFRESFRGFLDRHVAPFHLRGSSEIMKEIIGRSSRRVVRVVGDCIFFPSHRRGSLVFDVH